MGEKEEEEFDSGIGVFHRFIEFLSHRLRGPQLMVTEQSQWTLALEKE